MLCYTYERVEEGWRVQTGVPMLYYVMLCYIMLGYVMLCLQKKKHFLNHHNKMIF